MPANLENSAVATGLEKSVFIPIPKKSNAKECSNYHTIALIPHASKVILKIPQARLQQHVNRGLPYVQAWFKKDRGTRDQIADIHWMIEKARDSRKTSASALLTIPKPLTVWITTKCGKFFKRWESQTTWPEKSVCRSWSNRTRHGTKQTGSKMGKEYVKAIYCHRAYLSYMQSTSCKMPGWMKHKLESRLPEEISITSDMQMKPPLWQKQRTKEPLDESEGGEWKCCFKSQHSKNNNHGILVHLFMTDRWETMETVKDFIFGGSKITARGDCSHEIKICLLLGRKAMTNLDSMLKSRDITLPT